ncbi:MAG TPA: exodeoxyribonuclease VII large subunit [Candidatus Dormibacteraeota bacterium]|nr:exodeoxyribonuclease VII large subunit [Candidatus Dormibacteraeota bacterium]
MKDHYLTVTALTKYIKRKIDTDPHLNDIWLKGEISNFKHHSRGHMYLTIKDDQSRVQAVMFAGNNRKLKFTPEDGMNVLIRGEISVFEPYGQYQLYIRHMEPDGIGALYLAYEQLKEKLAKKGYFEIERKKELPPYPKHIGIITSPTGAAIRDILTTIKRRYPIVQTTVIPVIVQGQLAANSIHDAIEFANQTGDFDLLIVGRGGGSIEDLWGFNEEVVAEAIFQSNIPIISAVGHETDHTIADFVADLRAPTPTGAAELAVPSQQELLKKIEMMKRSLMRTMAEKIGNVQRHLDYIETTYAFKYPINLIQQHEQQLDRYAERLGKGLTNLAKNKQERHFNMHIRLQNQHPRRQIENNEAQLEQLVNKKNILFQQFMEQKTSQLSTSIDKLSLLNPLEILKRGFAIPYTQKSEVIKSSKQVNKDDKMTVRLSDGIVDCHVIDVREHNK